MVERPVNILMVEDNPGDVRYITELLKDTTFAHSNLFTASSLGEALNMPLEPSAMTMVLLDLNLPDSNGLHTLDALVRPFAASAIIVLTGMDDEQLALEALRQGAQSYLTKGRIGSDLLERELRYAVERHWFIMRLKEVDNELKMREQRFRSLVEYSSDHTLILSRSGRITYTSPVMHRLIGLVPLGTSVFQLVDPADVPELKAKLELALEHHERPIPLLVHGTDIEGRPVVFEGTITNLRAYLGSLS